MRQQMQDMKIYILIEDKENEAEVRIDGNLEKLRGLIDAIWTELTASSLVTTLSDEDPKQCIGGNANVTG
jgi:hypothetical protein